MMILKQHPLSAAFPPLAPDKMAELKADIEQNGQLMTIITLDNMVLEGWNRYQCCVDLGIEPRTKPLGEEINPADFVRSMNVFRRHLSESQRAIAEVSVSNWYAVGRPKNTPDSPTARTNAEMAASAEVHTATIERAKAVVAHGTPEIINAVKEGKMTVSEAERKVERPDAYVPNKDELEKAHIRINEVCGKVVDEAIAAGTMPPIKPGGYVLWAGQSKEHIRQMRHLIMSAGLTPDRALNVIKKPVNQNSTVRHACLHAMSRGGTHKSVVDGFVIYVEQLATQTGPKHPPMSSGVA
jgi:hypothetical protein